MKLITFLLLFLSLSVFAQNDRENYNLLWEISGNGLEKPSYLFGTMHVQDERAFQFSDSVIIAMENVDAFAMEIHPDSMMSILIDLAVNGDTTNTLRDILSEEAYERLNQLVIDKKGIPIDSLDVKDPSWIELMLSDFEEPGDTEKRSTVVDLYLFNLAYDLGKSTYGLEQFKDYVNLTNVFFNSFEKEEYEKTDLKKEQEEKASFYNEMIKIYHLGNLEEIQKFVKKGAWDEDYEKEILDNRNFRMVDSLELLMKDESVFCGVGVAHLSGKYGMIEILKEKGFKVRKVEPTFTGYAGNFKVTKVERPWIDYQLKEFDAKISFPKKPFEVNIDLGDLYPKYETCMAVDIGTNRSFLTMVLYHPKLIVEANDKTFYNGFIERWASSQKAEIVQQKRIKVKGINGVQVTMKDDERGFSVWQIVKVGSIVFLQSVIHEDGDFDRAEIDRFFNSLENKESGKPEPYKFISEEGAFTCELPLKPRFRKANNQTDEYGVERNKSVNMFIALDNVTNYQFIAGYSDNPAGVIYLDNDTVFQQLIVHYEERFGISVNNYSVKRFKNYEWLEAFFFFKDSELCINVILRGNRMYLFLVQDLVNNGDLKKQNKNFLNSVEFLPLTFMNLKPNPIDESFQIGFPNEVIIDESGSGNGYPYQDTKSYNSLDTLSSVSYSCYAYKLSPFYTEENFDSLLNASRDTINNFENKIYFADTTFQSGRAFYIKSFQPESDVITHEFSFYRGSYYFHLAVYSNAEIPDKIVWEYFNSFQIKNDLFTIDYIQKNKKEALWEAVFSRDSTALADAKYEIRNNQMDENDLPNIFKALEYDFSYDTLSYQSMKDLLFSQLRGIDDPSILTSFETLYKKSGQDKLLQLDILNAAVKIKSDDSFQLFFKYIDDFKNEDPEKYYLWSTYYSFIDTLSLTKNYFPEIMELMDHGIFQPISLYLANNLLKDSMVSVDVLQTYTDQILKTGEAIILEHDLLNKDSIKFDDPFTGLNSINGLVSFLPLADNLDNFIKKQFKAKNNKVISSAIKAALKLGIPVENDLYEKIFESKYDLYNLLNEAKQDSTLDKIPNHFYNQEIIVESRFAYDSYYEYGPIHNFKIIKKEEVSKNEKQYRLYLVEFNIKGYDELQIGICTQPMNGEEVNIPPDYFTYIDWYEDKKSKEEAIEQIMGYFEKWEGK